MIDGSVLRIAIDRQSELSGALTASDWAGLSGVCGFSAWLRGLLSAILSGGCGIGGGGLLKDIDDRKVYWKLIKQKIRGMIKTMKRAGGAGRIYRTPYVEVVGTAPVRVICASEGGEEYPLTPGSTRSPWEDGGYL